ncbi:unnamed protein product [Phyllotreta striolata]|uniref:BHLH domain-containing protein n=1 Tax=Phyllotreta striolata TaxID=444603 RepID=A0A9P0DX21_PHYSR|nr:unnamed protein product [Phyllotreta striolata]
MTNGERSSFSIKDIKMALSSEDMGFCSSEDYLENELHSPTDSSEDSVEVKVSAISLTKKRKAPETFTGPLKKRMCLKVKAEINDSHPFRPWSPAPPVAPKQPDAVKTEEPLNFQLPKIECQNAARAKAEAPFAPYFRPPSPAGYAQSEPEDLVKKRDPEPDDIRVPVHPQIQNLSAVETERLILKSTEVFPNLGVASGAGVGVYKKSAEAARREQRNYKNMTRERRIEANARERTRVHTISAAFDTLRRSIPSYSHNQKLSKLSVLRIACSYIMTLSSMLEDESTDPPVAECVDLVTRTIQREGKLRKKKDDND